VLTTGSRLKLFQPDFGALLEQLQSQPLPRTHTAISRLKPIQHQNIAHRFALLQLGREMGVVVAEMLASWSAPRINHRDHAADVAARCPLHAANLPALDHGLAHARFNPVASTC